MNLDVSTDCLSIWLPMVGFSLYHHLNQLATLDGVREEDEVDGLCDISYILSTDGKVFLELFCFSEPEFIRFLEHSCQSGMGIWISIMVTRKYQSASGCESLIFHVRNLINSLIRVILLCSFLMPQMCNDGSSPFAGFEEEVFVCLSLQGNYTYFRNKSHLAHVRVARWVKNSWALNKEVMDLTTVWWL